MQNYEYTWDPVKADKNLLKHRVSFNEARTVFKDPFARVKFDSEHSSDEERFIILGLSSYLKVLIVCYCCRSSDNIRIISARKATREEQKDYVRLR